MQKWRDWHFSSVVAICWCRGTENSSPLSRWRSCRWFRRGSVAGHFYFFLSRMTSAFKKQRNCCNFLDQKVAWNAYGVQVERLNQLNQLNQFFLHRGLSWFICLPFSPGTAGFNCFKLGKSKGGRMWGVKINQVGGQGARSTGNLWQCRCATQVARGFMGQARVGHHQQQTLCGWPMMANDHRYWSCFGQLLHQKVGPVLLAKCRLALRSPIEDRTVARGKHIWGHHALSSSKTSNTSNSFKNL